MAETAASQLRRILHLIPLCEDDVAHPIEEMAATLGSDRKTLLRDLKALSERFDDPGGFVEGVQVFVEPGRFSLKSDHFRRPMRLTLGELGALDLGLAMLERERPPDEQDAIGRARGRLLQVLTSLPRDSALESALAADQGADADPETLRVLRDALRHGRMLSIRYASGSAAAATERQVGPLALAPSRGHWFLVALFEGSIRIYRVDRIEAPSSGGPSSGSSPAGRTCRLSRPTRHCPRPWPGARSHSWWWERWPEGSQQKALDGTAAGLVRLTARREQRRFQYGTIMEPHVPTLTIKGLPQPVYQRLKAQAEAHHRSLNGEIIWCLERAVGAARLDAAAWLAQARAFRDGLALAPLTDRELREARRAGRA